MVTHLVCIGVLGEDRKEFTAFGAAEFRHIKEHFSRKRRTPESTCDGHPRGYCTRDPACNE